MKGVRLLRLPDLFSEHSPRDRETHREAEDERESKGPKRERTKKWKRLRKKLNNVRRKLEDRGNRIKGMLRDKGKSEQVNGTRRYAKFNNILCLSLIL